MLTRPSSAEVIQLQPNQPTVRNGFEAWRESWLRAVFADDNLWGSDKNVTAFLALHLNRETRSCWPSYGTIARGLGIDRSNARRSVRRLIARGYLVRKPRGKGQSNAYFPTGVGVVTVTTEVLSQLPSRTSDSTSESTLGKEPKDLGGLPKGEPKKESKPASELSEQAKRWIAEGKSQFTGLPLWKGVRS